jgi:hypothetical protein
VEEGATVVTGGGVPDHAGELAEGCWVQPTIWTGLPETAAVVREEIFGPCCHIRPFDSEDEVVRLANDTDYGLSHHDLDAEPGARHRVAEPSRWASPGSTAGSCATCAPLRRQPSSPASAAKAACIRWSSIPRLRNV